MRGLVSRIGWIFEWLLWRRKYALARVVGTLISGSAFAMLIADDYWD